MKLRMIGLVVSLLSILAFNGCTKIEKDTEYISLNSSERDLTESYVKKELKNPNDNILKDFGKVDTKYTMTPIWVAGDMICVYSLDDNDTIIFKDTCTVYNINNNVARITAEVAKKCKRYFASYPYNHIQGNVGEKLDLSQEGYINHTGIFGDESIMTSFCPSNGNVFNFSNRYSLFELENVSKNNFPISITFYWKNGNSIKREYTTYNDSELYSSIWYQKMDCSKIELEYQDNGNVKSTLIPNQSLEPASVYPYDLRKKSWHRW